MMLEGGATIGAQNPAQHDLTASPCQATGKTEIRIDCTFGADQASGTSDEQEAPRIVLNRALITFEPAHESRMHIELTFTNKGSIALAEARTVYIEFDDEAGENHIRRPLPHVNLQKLAPNIAMTFADQFLAPALQPGRYRVYLWIPSSDPKLKFDAAHNFLLGNEEVAERDNGLNRIAAISVEAGGRSRRSDTH
jgi:hypothetical protein